MAGDRVRLAHFVDLALAFATDRPDGRGETRHIPRRGTPVVNEVRIDATGRTGCQVADPIVMQRRTSDALLLAFCDAHESQTYSPVHDRIPVVFQRAD